MTLDTINLNSRSEVDEEQLTRSPNYIELVKWKGYADGKGSPYGKNNVFGAGTSVIKGLK